MNDQLAAEKFYKIARPGLRMKRPLPKAFYEGHADGDILTTQRHLKDVLAGALGEPVEIMLFPTDRKPVFVGLTKKAVTNGS